MTQPPLPKRPKMPVELPVEDRGGDPSPRLGMREREGAHDHQGQGQKLDPQGQNQPRPRGQGLNSLQQLHKTHDDDSVIT